MLFQYEFKKLLPMLIGFAVLCIALNGVIAIAGYNDYTSDEKVEMVNIFEGFQAGELAETYIRKYNVTEENAEHIRNKYEKLQPVVEEKAEEGDALSTYFKGQTYYRHGMLFKTMFMVIIAECCLLALFAALLSATYENLRGTENIVCASKVGRGVLLTKLRASLTATILLTAVIVGASLFIFFLRFDFSQVWGDNVSSMFNFAAGEFGKPFITWRSYTVLAYLWATIGVTFGLTLCFCMLGYAAGILVRSGYGAFVTAMLVVGVTFLAKPLFPIGSTLRAALGITPVWLWKDSGRWFTDGGADIIWANFESIGTVASFILLSIAAYTAIKIFKKRELL